MYVLIGATFVLLGLAVSITLPGDAAARGAIPRSRRVQPHTRDVHDLIAREAALARDSVYRQMVGLGS
jgi:hypothetical protein